MIECVMYNLCARARVHVGDLFALNCLTLSKPLAVRSARALQYVPTTTRHTVSSARSQTQPKPQLNTFYYTSYYSKTALLLRTVHHYVLAFGLCTRARFFHSTSCQDAPFSVNTFPALSASTEVAAERAFVRPSVRRDVFDAPTPTLCLSNVSSNFHNKLNYCQVARLVLLPHSFIVCGFTLTLKLSRDVRFLARGSVATDSNILWFFCFVGGYGSNLRTFIGELRASAILHLETGLVLKKCYILSPLTLVS